MNYKKIKDLLHTLKGNIYIVLIFRLLIVMLLFSISRVVFYLLNAEMYSGMSLAHFSKLLIGGMRFDIVATLYTNMLYLLASILPFQFRYHAVYQKVLQWIFFVTNSLMLAINSIDFIYYRFTLRRTTWTVISEFSNDKGNFSLMGQFLKDFWYILLIWMLMIALMVWLYKRVKIRPTQIGNPWIYYPIHAVLMTVSFGVFVLGARGGIQLKPIRITNAVEYIDKPIETGIVLNTPFSIYRTLKQTKVDRINYYKTEEKLEAVYSPIHRPTQDSLAFTPKNVVILIVESLSKEYIGSMNPDIDGGHYKGYTPFLDSLIKESYTFEHSFANGSKSIEGMTAILTSIPSFNEPYSNSIYCNNKIRGLATLLSEKGYDCSFFHGANNGSMGFDAFSRIAGFQHYYGKNEFNNNAEYDGVWGIWDEPFLQYFAQQLNQKKQPFLASVFTLTSHHPFQIPKQYKGQFPKGDQEIHKCMGYVDMALRRFFDTAKKMPWYKNTLFVITGDHQNQVSYEKSKTAVGRFSVPILFYDPNGKLKGVDRNRTVQQIDLMPTILNYLHYDKPYFAYGFDAFSKDTNKAFAVNYIGVYQMIQNGYLLQTSEQKPTSLFKYTADTLLQHNIKDKEPAVAKQMNDHFWAFYQQYTQRLEENRMTYQEGSTKR